MANRKYDIPTITIIGAGFSGISLAANLYQFAKSPLKIIIVGSPALFGKGIAYSTTNLLHLLNVRVKDMSAFSHDDEHFLNWLLSRKVNRDFPSDPMILKDHFVPRYLYGLYLDDILRSMAKPSTSGCFIELIKDEAISVVESEKNMSVYLRSGRTLNTDKLVLAHGYLLPKTHFSNDGSVAVIENPWDYQSYREISSNSSVLILGTGLTMIDAVIQLKSQNHQGKIYTLSRRGLIPKMHQKEAALYLLDDNLCAMGLVNLVKLIKSELQKSHDDAAKHQAIFRALRLKANHIWNLFTLFEKKQFLRHLLPYWDAQRHRIPQEIDHYLSQLLAEGLMELIKGRLCEIKNKVAIVQPRYQNTPRTLEIGWVINCTGPGHYTQDNINPIIKSLLSQGMAVVNELNLGLNVSSSGALVNTSNTVSDKLFVLGPPLRGILFECTAVKEIKVQSIELTMSLLKGGRGQILTNRQID